MPRIRAAPAGTPSIEGKQFIAEYRFKCRPPVAAGKGVIAVVNHVHGAVIPEALHCGSRLKLEQINSGLSARKYEYYTHTSRREILKFPSKIPR